VKTHTRFQLHALVWLCCLVLVASACRRDPCKRLDCQNGECVDGTCVCNQGYGGDLCEFALNTQYDGQYQADEKCLAGDDDYLVGLSPKPGTADSVIATGLWGKRWAVTLGTRQESGDLYCPRQRFGSMEISLEGQLDEIDDNLLELSYRLYYVGHASHFDACTATLTRQ
jgi:hypothetical protein